MSSRALHRETAQTDCVIDDATHAYTFLRPRPGTFDEWVDVGQIDAEVEIEQFLRNCNFYSFTNVQDVSVLAKLKQALFPWLKAESRNEQDTDTFLEQGKHQKQRRAIRVDKYWSDGSMRKDLPQNMKNSILWRKLALDDVVGRVHLKIQQKATNLFQPDQHQQADDDDDNANDVHFAEIVSAIAQWREDSEQHKMCKEQTRALVQ